jgi:hypothetical protein
MGRINPKSNFCSWGMADQFLLTGNTIIVKPVLAVKVPSD